jgi:trimethylguanosine synthase
VIALDTNPTRLALARHNAQIYGVADRIEFIQADYISFAHSLTSTSSSSLTTSPPQSNLPRKIDVVFLSPPWGGPSYLSGSPSRGIADGNKENSPQTTGQGSHPTYSLSSIQPIHGQDLFTLTRKITSNIAYYLPRNTDLSEISGLLNAIDDQGSPVRLPGEQIEVEEEWMGSKLKALTCYFGGLVAGQEELFC